MHIASRVVVTGLLVVLTVTSAAAEPIQLGAFTFDSQLFGDSVLQSAGLSTILAPDRNWLNVVNENPGLLGALTGPNFNTALSYQGRGFGSDPEYFPVRTIGYSTPIVNRAGADFGIVTSRVTGSLPPGVGASVSRNGVDFLGKDGVVLGPWPDPHPIDAIHVGVGGLIIATGQSRTFFLGPICDPVPCAVNPLVQDLYVTSIDLSDFGLAEGEGVQAVRIQSQVGLNLVRIAGFDRSIVEVPEPAILRRLLPKHLLGRELNVALNPRLQRLTAWGATAVLRMIQVPVSRRDTFVDLPTVSLEVQAWCSGFTFMKWLVLLALLIAVVSPQTLPWKVALVLLAPVIAIEANVLRVVGIGLSLEWLGHSFKDWMGTGMMVAGVVQVVVVGRWMNRRGRA